MDAKMIGLILSGLFGAILLFGFIWGLIRGLKKTVFRTIWVIVTGIVLFFVSSLITKALMDFNLSTFGVSFKVGGQQANSLSEYIGLFIQTELDFSAESAASICQLGVSIVSLGINALIFLVLFWLLKYLLLPFYWIFSLTLFKYKKKELVEGEAGKVKKTVVKIKRHPLLGGLLGLFLGLFIAIFTFSPIVGYISLVEKVETESAKINGTDKGIVSENLGETYNLITDAYNDSIIGKVYKTIGLEVVSNGMFNYLSSSKINGEKVYLNKEITAVVQVYDWYADFEMIDLETCTQAEMTDFLSKVEIGIKTIFSSNLVSGSIDTIMPIIEEELGDKIEFKDQPEYVNALVKEMAMSIIRSKSSEIKDEAMNVIALVKTLNNHRLLLPLFQGLDGQDTLIFFKENLTKTASDNIVERLFALKSASDVAPELLNAIMGIAGSQLDFTAVEETEVTTEVLKNSVGTILGSVVDILANISKDNGTEVSENALVPAGRMFDAVKGLISEQNFNSIIGKIEPKLDKVVQNAVDSAPKFFSDNLKIVVNNIHNIESYEVEFTKIRDGVYNLRTCFENAENENGEIKPENLDFARLGKGLDYLQTCTLFDIRDNAGNVTGNVVTDMLLGAIDEYADDINKKVSEEFVFEALTQVKANIENAGKITWETELPRYKKIVEYATDLIESEDSIIDQIRDDANPIFTNIGKQLDELNSSVILGNGAVKMFVQDILNALDEQKLEFADDENINNSITSAIDDIQTNVENATVISWQTEFTHIKSLMALDFDSFTTENVVVIGQKLDDILNDNVVLGTTIPASKIITQPVVNKIIYSLIDSVFEGVDNTSELYDSITKIKESFGTGENAVDIENYEVEFVALTNLKDLEEIVSADGFEFTEADAQLVGSTIDNSIVVTVNGRQYTSKIVTREFVDEYIVDLIDSLLDDASGTELEGIIEDIKFGFVDVDSSDSIYENKVSTYEIELITLSRLKNLATLVSDVDFDFVAETGEKNGKTLGQKVDTLLAGVEVDETLIPSGVITQTIIDAYIKDKIDTFISEDVKEEIGTTLLSDIKAKFNGTAIKKYEVEFIALSKLQTIANTTKGMSNFSVVAEELGEAIDNALAQVVINKEGFNSVIVTKKLINDHITTVIQDITLDTKFANVKTKICSRLSNLFSYKTEFGYIATLITISENVGSVGIDTINTATVNGKTLGENFDDLAVSVLVGDAGLDIVQTILDEQTEDDVVDAIKDNYTTLRNEIKCMPNGNYYELTGTKSYVDLFNAVAGFDALIDKFNAYDITTNGFDATIAGEIESELHLIQSNILVKISGSRKIASKIMNEVITYIDSLFLDETIKDELKEYPEDYKDYLLLSSTIPELYNSTTESYVQLNGRDVYVNKPFTRVYNAIQNKIGA